MKYAINMQKYALHQISVQLYKYARNMHKICNYMQYMSSRNLYAEYAEICIPHFADGGLPQLPADRDSGLQVRFTGRPRPPAAAACH